MFKLRKRISDILIEAGLINQQQLDRALILQKNKNKRLGKILVELGYVTERQIAEALSQQLTLPLVDCDQYEITEEVKALVPKEIAEKKIIMPLEVKAKTLWLAMADPLDWETMGEIGFMTGLNVNNVIACETNLLGAIEKHYGAEEKVSFTALVERLEGKLIFRSVFFKFYGIKPRRLSSS